MGILKNFFKSNFKKSEKYSDFTWKLKIAVTLGLSSLPKEYALLIPILKKTRDPAGDWDFYMMIAGVGMIAMLTDISRENYREMGQTLIQMNKQKPWEDGLTEFSKFITNPEEENTSISERTGWWILNKLKGAPPSQEENTTLGPAIGAYLETAIEDLFK